MFASLSRYRHTRGFGVHSPYAFRFLRDVVHDLKDAHYYSYAYCKEIAAGLPKRVFRRYGMLFKLVARETPEFIFLSPRLDIRLESLLHQASPSARFRIRIPEEIPPSSLLICYTSELPADCRGLMAAGSKIALFELKKGGPEAIDSLASCMDGGWTFEGLDMAFFINEQGVNLQRLKINLP